MNNARPKLALAQLLNGSAMALLRGRPTPGSRPGASQSGREDHPTEPKSPPGDFLACAVDLTRPTAPTEGLVQMPRLPSVTRAAGRGAATNMPTCRPSRDGEGQNN